MLRKGSLCGLLALMLIGGLNAVAAEVPLTPMEQLGKLLFFDKLSEPGSMSCADCHGPSTGFTGPIPGINLHGAVYPGAVPQRAGNRKPPAASYATLSPVFDFDPGEGLFIGGNFWDGRATGEHLGNPAADQALGPFLNPVEQNNPSKMVVVQKVAESKYAWLWEEAWGEPISYANPADVETNYDRIGLAIKEYEASREVNAFTSKFDMFWENVNTAGMDVRDINMANWSDYSGLGLNKNELEGLALFNDEDKGKCSLCHVMDPAIDEYGNMLPPVFTDFTYDNLGVPKNPENPFYDMDEVYLDDGTPINPMGADWIDPGLGGFLAYHPNPAWQAMAEENYGKHKVPSLRNVDKRPSEEFPKAYTHNGVFKSLLQVVHFYNTRDVEDWPPPEVAETVNTEELGDLGLSKREERLIVAFMQTLSDGYTGEPGEKPESDVASVAGLAAPTISPNPFNPITTISYSLATPGEVELSIYTVEGKKVATLVDGWQAAGDHVAPFDASRLSSGIYFVSFESGGETVTAKAVLLK
jgi:cytochrome c peroxidase